MRWVLLSDEYELLASSDTFVTLFILKLKTI